MKSNAQGCETNSAGDRVDQYSVSRLDVPANHQRVIPVPHNLVIRSTQLPAARGDLGSPRLRSMQKNACKHPIEWIQVEEGKDSYAVA
jgi:hypothetical protein